MKAQLIREQTNLENSIWFDDSEYKHFYNPWHYHPELELTLIVKSYGLRHVGDSIENFSKGDLVLIGSNLPHLWLNDNVFFEKDSNNSVKAIVVKFRPDFLGNHFLNLSEMKDIHNLIFVQAAFGVKLNNELRKGIEKKLISFVELDETKRLIMLIDILDEISKSKDYTLLSSISYRNAGSKQAHRISTVLDYLAKNYHKELTLDEVAEQINMNKNAFCRFFKKGTRKNLFTVVNEVRISKACNLLIETKMDVVQICFAVGYNNISNFYKAFKKVSGVSPLVYRKNMKK
ncbi:MAG: AraC family transcriptional regulator [Reichenbachiella sp.]